MWHLAVSATDSQSEWKILSRLPGDLDTTGSMLNLALSADKVAMFPAFSTQLLQDRILTHWTQKAPHLTPLTLLATLDSSLMNILPSLIKFRPSPKLAITISDSFVVSVLTLIPTQLAPLPPPSFTPNSITVILSTTYLSLRSPACLQQIQNSLARVVVKTPKCCHITPILQSYTVLIGPK